MTVWRTVGPSASLSAAATAGSGWKLKRTELSRDERASGEATERQVELAYVGSQFTNGQGSYGLSYGELVIEE